MSSSTESFLPKRRALVSIGVLGFILAIGVAVAGAVGSFLLLRVVREDQMTTCPSLEKIYALTDLVGTTRSCFEDQHLKINDLEFELDVYEMRFREVVEEIPDPKIYAMAFPLKDHFSLFVEEGLAYQKSKVELKDTWRQAQLVNRRSKILQEMLEMFQTKVLAQYRGRLIQMELYSQGFFNLFLVVMSLTFALGAVCLRVLRRVLKRADSKGGQLRVDLEASVGRDLAKTQFLSLISHGMRTPISSVLGMAELLGQSHLSQVQKKYLSNIVESAEAQLPFLDNILDMSQQDSGEVPLTDQPFSFRQLLDEVLLKLRGSIEREGGIFRLLYSPSLPLFVQGDRHKVERLLYNLLQKVLVLSDEGVILIRVASSSPVNSTEVNIELQVAYRGGPRIEEGRDFAFENLLQRNDPFSRHWSGVCLGLFVCRDLCRGMKGDLQVDHDGVEQIFRAQLHFKCDGEVVAEGLPLNGKKVLISFRDDVLSGHFQELLEHWGFVVELAGEEKLQELLVDQDLDGADVLFCCSELILNLPPSLKLSCSVPLLLFGSETEVSGAGEYPLVFEKASWVPDAEWGERPLLSGLESVFGEQVCHTIANLDHFKAGDRFVDVGTSRWSPKLKVLMVEDDAMNRVVAREMFASLFIRIDIACDGIEAVASCARTSYDIIFMDLLMPECDGYEACRRIRAAEGLGEKTPIVALTASACEHERLRCTNVGIDEVLTKPIRMESLSHCLKKWLPESLKQADSFHSGSDESREKQPVEVGDVRENNAFDWQYVLKLTAGRERAAQRVIGVFVDNLPKNIEAISAAISVGDREGLRREAHTLKSSALYGGARALSEVARRLEQEVKDAGVSQMALALEKEIQLARQAFLAALEDASTEGFI